MFCFVGRVTQSAPWDSKVIYNYEFVIKLEGKAPTPVAAFLSNDHHEYEIAHWLARLFQRVNQVTSKTVRFQIICFDMSRAITNSALQEFCGMSMAQYLHACVKAKELQKIPFVLLAWCYSHFLSAGSKNAKDWLPLSGPKKFSPARKLIRFTMAAMARSETVEQAVEIFRPFVHIVQSKDLNEDVYKSLKCLAIR